MQRLGFREAVIISDSDEVAADLTAPSWARADVALSFHRKNAKAVSVSEISADFDRTLVVSAGFYYDARLLKALAEQKATTVLVDSAPPPDCTRLWRNESHALGVAALCGAYNAAAWLSRREQHLAINTVLYAALIAFEQQHVSHHIAELRKPMPGSTA
jgi:hypothetical protein